MRLGQLARKLAIRPAEIVDFLASQEIRIEERGNTKLEDHFVALVLQHFAPNGADLGEVEEDTEAVEATAKGDPKLPVPEGTLEDEVVDDEIREKDDVELIKAPKVELSGLKVLGKIDLPEPKKKEPIQESSADAGSSKSVIESTNQTVSVTQPKSWRSAKSPKSVVNPIALQRERQAREADQKKREQIEREKEHRTLHYLKKMNAIRPTKAMKIAHDEPEEETLEVDVAHPKGWWRRFMRWLNT